MQWRGSFLDFVNLITTMPSRHSGDQAHRVNCLPHCIKSCVTVKSTYTHAAPSLPLGDSPPPSPGLPAVGDPVADNAVAITQAWAQCSAVQLARYGASLHAQNTTNQKQLWSAHFQSWP